MSQVPDSQRKRPGGFTLVEVIVALTVVAVALSIFISMFLSAARLAEESRNSLIASELAESYLNILTASPDAFLWDVENPEANGLFMIHENAASGRSFMPPHAPDTMLAMRSAHEQNVNLYNKFEHQAWGRLPSPDAEAYEVTVAVRWRAQGRLRWFALTSSLPRFKIDDSSANGMADEERAR